MKRSVRNAPISVYITIAITIVVIGAIAVLSGYAFLESRDHLVRIETGQRDAAETSLVEYHRLMDRDLAFFDELFSDRLHAAFPPFLNEYERAGGNPSAMDLARIRDGLGAGYDLYVIDSRGVIIATTFADELGYNLADYPGFGETLTAMRLGDGFVSDRIVQEKVNGSYRKYAYHPTPDHRYLLEIGLKDEAVVTAHTKLYTPFSVDDLKAKAPSLLNVTLYNVLKRPLRMPNGTQPRDAASLSKAISSRKTVDSVDAANATRTRYIFIDLLDPVYASDPSLVAETVYSTRPLEDALSLLALEHFLIAVLAIGLGVLFAGLLATVMTRPIRGLVDDIERVADGDLDHPLSDAGTAELGLLRQSIDRMTGRLREQLAAIRASEQRVREQNESLERRVYERTRELDEANQEAHLYIDIMLHDFRRALSPLLPRAEALAAGLDGEQADEAVRIGEAIRQCSQVLECVAWVDRYRHLDSPLEEVALDRAIRDGIARHPDLRVQYEGTDELVQADGFLSEVFSNLLGDSRHYGGSGVNCRIRVERRNGEVLVSLEDDGPGIPDREKERIFARPAREKGGVEEPVLGLSIAGALVRRYGGRIWADDRVSDYARGTVIRITLPRPEPAASTA